MYVCEHFNLMTFTSDKYGPPRSTIFYTTAAILRIFTDCLCVCPLGDSNRHQKGKAGVIKVLD